MWHHLPRTLVLRVRSKEIWPRFVSSPHFLPTRKEFVTAWTDTGPPLIWQRGRRASHFWSHVVGSSPLCLCRSRRKQLQTTTFSNYSHRAWQFWSLYFPLNTNIIIQVPITNWRLRQNSDHPHTYTHTHTHTHHTHTHTHTYTESWWKLNN